MKRGYIGLILFIILIISSTALLVIGHSIAPRDVSWIETVEDFIGKEWKPNSTFWGLEYAAFFLHENGKEQFFILNSSQLEFISYMDCLAGKVDRQLAGSVSREYVDEILAADKVLAYSHRFLEGFGHFGLYESYAVAYFILEDKTGRNLEGTIIMQDRHSENSHFSVWQITDWIL